MRRFLLLPLAVLLLSACGGDKPNSATPTAFPTSPPASSLILSAFFGLDDALPPSVNLLCKGGAGKDGVVLVFAEELNPDSVQADDFRVVTRSGASNTPLCATLAPATDDGDRTVLLIGDLGSASDPPVSVEVAGSLMTKQSRELQGQRSPSAVPLNEGPSLSWAAVVALDAQRNDPCPPQTKQVVRVWWSGGVRRPDGSEVAEKERQGYSVLVDEAGGRDVVPFALADLNDNDNVHDLCLDTTAKPVSVRMRAKQVADPHGDLNPETIIELPR